MPPRLPASRGLQWIAWLPVLWAPGCRPDRPTDAPAAGSVTVYCSVDEQFARGILERFRRETGIEPAILTDSEAGKTTGLVRKIIAESQAGRPRADVFWSSEIFHTIRLARMGLLKPYDPPTAADIPDRFKDAAHRWTATAVRARVIAFDPKRTPRANVPSRWEALAGAEYAGRTALANPLFGTTRGHVAAMFALWGRERGRAFLERLRDGGVHIADGNSAAVRALMSRRVSFAATDTDDVLIARQRGESVDLVYPDMGDGGTLLIPCTVALIGGRPHSEPARKLVDFLVSAEVERLLAQSESRNIPVRRALRRELGMDWPAETKLGFEAIADAMDEAATAAREILLR